jgi:hypothetical protein
MSLEVMVNLIFLISSFVESFSDMTILVPSDRTTFSRGEMRKANGRLEVQLVSIGKTHAMHSMMRNAR